MPFLCVETRFREYLVKKWSITTLIDIQMIFATVLGKKIEYAGEVI